MGDATYTANAPKHPSASLGLTRQFLHSYRIGFEHPFTGASVELVDGLPDDLACVLASLRERTSDITDYGREVFQLMGMEA